MMKPKGFSLIEVMVASLILSLIVAGMFGIFVTGKGFVIRAGHKTGAINLARQRMEEVKSWDYSSLTEGDYEDSPGIGGTISATRTLVIGSVVEGKRVEVTLEWTVAGVTRTEEIVTLIADPG